jgi:Ankyrin repeats (3 copies)
LGHIDIVKILLEKGAEINNRTSYGRTALMDAALEGQIDIVKILLESGAEINVGADDYGWTIWHIAAWKPNAALISLLWNSQDGSTGTVNGTRDKEEFSSVESALQFLTTEFPEDHILWRALGNEFMRQQRYREVIRFYDISFGKLNANTTGNTTGIGSRGISGFVCYECWQKLEGYDYKCKSCHWNYDFCEKCMKLGTHEHPPEDLFRIPSQLWESKHKNLLF